MAGVDSLLRMLSEHGADELRLATDEAPRMLKRGAPVRLSIPPTGIEILRHLLEPLLPPEREAELRDAGRLEATYQPESGGGAFSVTLQSRGGKLEATFRAGAAVAARPAPPTLRAVPPAATQSPAGGAAGAALSPPPSAGARSPGASPAGASVPPSFGASAGSSFGVSVPPSGGAAAGLPSSGAPGLSSSGASAGGTSGLSSSGAAAGLPAGGASSTAMSGAGAPVPSSFAAPAAGATSASGPSLGGATGAGSALTALLRRAIALGASDVHLMTGERPTVRIDGQLRGLDEPPVAVEELLAGAVDDHLWPRAFAGRSADAAFDVVGLGRFRVNLYRASDRLAAALRVLPRSAPSLAELNLPASLEELVAAPHGLILVSGATGSGKSATLAALAQAALRRRTGLLVSLEDPIEYGILGERGSLVRQRQIGSDVTDFATGLRDALREDPDVLLIGEMRDPETIGLALTAAETGHLVLASLHSRSAASSVERIVDSYVGARQQQVRLQLADSLRAVVAQRLLPRAHGAGRLPAIELLRVNQNVASLIREGKTAQIMTAMQSSRKDGMLPLERCLADLVRADQVTREQALAAANDPASLLLYLQS
jgi:twitching motility protein PilT